MITHKEYIAANARLEKLLAMLEGEDDSLDKELVLVSDIIEQYEDVHFPM